jgi:hypothetical protein
MTKAERRLRDWLDERLDYAYDPRADVELVLVELWVLREALEVVVRPPAPPTWAEPERRS